MSSNQEPTRSRTDPRIKRIGIFAGIVVLAFLLGLVPMGLKAWRSASERDAAQHQLRLCNLQLTLASAAINARRAEYENARQNTSEFFTDLHNQLEDNTRSDLTQTQRDGLKPLINDRDNLITLLARGDPASADRLSDLYAAYQKVMGKAQS
jgi:hypothetical protein